MKLIKTILLSLVGVILIGAIYFGVSANKDSIAYFIAGYKIDYNGVVIYKDVKTLLYINETSKDNVNVELSLYPDSEFYNLPHNIQLMKAKDVNEYACRTIKNGNIINLGTSDIDGVTSSLGWEPLNHEYCSDVVSNIFDHSAMIMSITLEGMRVKYHKWNAPWQKDVTIDYIRNDNWTLDSIRNKYYKHDSPDTMRIQDTIKIESVEELQEYLNNKEEFVKKRLLKKN